MPRVALAIDISHAETMILLGTLRRELRCLWYAAQNPERRDRKDLDDRRRKLEPLIAILDRLCSAAKLAEQRHTMDADPVLTWTDPDTGEPQYALLEDPAAIPAAMSHNPQEKGPTP